VHDAGRAALYNQFQYKNPPYDPDKSFAPITNSSSSRKRSA
jgi:hypothetical protein